jgi:hypothetical protein
MGFGYHYHNVIREGNGPELERRHVHARALAEHPSAAPGRSRLNLIRRWAPEWLRRWRPGTSALGALGTDAHELTGSVCRLGDGSLGRIAIIRRPNEEWTAVCVKV